MGVTGLWKLIEASGKPVTLESLENKILAIDISIWLHQVVKGYQDNKGGQLANAHLLGLFNRVCKLLYFRIKPIFVFDGGIPELKRQTIAKRYHQKSKIQSEAERLEQLLLESLAKEKIVKQALGNPETLYLSPPKASKLKPTRVEERDEIFMLPPLNEENDHKEFKSELDEDDEDEDEMCPKRSYDVNINQIDVTSSHFKTLPADIRHDILTDIKETRKQNSWARLRELPVESNDFSTYQMSRLLRRRQVQVGLEDAEKEMGGKTWSLAELEALLSEDGVLDSNSKHCQKIASDENTRFLLVRDIAKAMNDAKNEDVAGPSSSAKTSSSEPSTSKEIAQLAETLDDEDFDLQRAIQLSLGNFPDAIDESEAVEPSDGRIKLNPEQRQKFSGTIQAHGLIRGFMMEYAEMNSDDIQELMEATQSNLGNNELSDPLRAKFPNTDPYVLYGSPEKEKTQDLNETKTSEKAETIKAFAISDNDSDDDLVEVPDEPKEKSAESEKVVITLDADLKDFKEEDDLFADVFDVSAKEASDESIAVEDVPDVEVASISSDDDTLPYDVSQSDFDALDEQKETESGFVSEEGKKIESVEVVEIVDDAIENIPAATENEKFWSVLSDDEPDVEAVAVKPSTVEVSKKVQELSENEKFWADEPGTVPDDVIEVEDEIQVEPALKTPLKLIRESSPPPAKVASPFFVNRKTPSSKKKTTEPIDADAGAVTKSLFSTTKPVENPLITLQKAAQELRSKNTSEELEQMKDQLASEQKNLAQEKNKMDRMGTTITESMSRDCKDLLKLFGIPYIDSPMEAEAQCAFLNMIELTDGTISDDSDIWLFGGKTVYKNFFVQKKIVMEFSYESIEQMFHLDRKKLIQLAMLVGSDYTTGINGVGAVTAMEILAAFPPTPETETGTDHYQSLVSSLRKFREWFQNGKEVGAGGKTVLKSKLKNVELFEGFPNQNIARAYLEPTIDTNAEKFTWGLPDSESLVEYAKSKLGWTRLKTEEILAPVMKRLTEKKQSTIKDYFKSQVTKKFFDNQKMSKRVQKAVGKMGGAEEEEAKEKLKQVRKRKAPVKKKKNDKSSAASEDNLDDLVLVLSDDDTVEPPEKKSSPESKPSTSTASESKVVKMPKTKPAPRKRKPKDDEPSTSSTTEPVPIKKRAPRIPNTKQIIPQREKDKEDQEKVKQKAIDIFKKAKAVKKN